MRKIKSIIASVVAFLICCLAVINPSQGYLSMVSATPMDDQISEYQQKLNELEQKEQELKDKLANTENSIEYEKERQELLDEQIQNTFETITTMQGYISELEDEIASLDEQIRKDEEEIAQREVEISQGIEDFGLRLRAMYIAGNDSYANVIIGSGDFYDTLMRVELVKRVAGYDDKVIDELIDLKKVQEAEVEALEIKRNEITEKMNEYSTEIENLTSEQTELQTLYDESAKSMEELEKWQSEYFEQQQQLNSDKNDTQQSLEQLEKEKAEFERRQQELLEEQKRKEEEQKRQEALGNTTPPTDGTVSDDGNSGNNDYSEEVYTGDVNTVIAMAKSMVGGRYVFGAASPTASDCSGLTMQCYAKIGISLPHKASMQANYGRAVSYDEMQPGDLIFYGGSSYSSIYHVALYIGDGKIIHAESTATGIVVSYSDSVARYNHITVIKRLVE